MMRNSLQRRLRMEMLEDKRPLAANLFVEVVNGDLIITGDGGDNRFTIQSGFPDGEQYELGNLGTIDDMINGMPFTGDDHFFSGVTGNIIINLGGGDDWLHIEGANGVDILEIPGDLRINVGSGNDRIALGVDEQVMFDGPITQLRPLDIGGDLVIDAGSGHDSTWIASVLVGDDFQYTHSAGDAHLSFVSPIIDPADGFESEIGDDFSVITGSGSDQIGLDSVNVGGDLLVSVASGDDSVGLTNFEVNGSSLVSLGAGFDQAEFQYSQLGTSLTVLGTGSNTVLMLDVSTTATIAVLTSNGNDFVGLGLVQTGTAIITTGAGSDEMIVIDSVFDNLLVTLGSGSDALSIGGTTVNGLALLLGGAGFDTWVDLGGNDILLELDLGFESLVL